MLIKGFSWPLGVASLSLICYFLPDWQNNQIVLTVFTFLSGISVIVFIKESPHYLIVKGRHKEASDIFHYMAKMNGKTIDDQIIEDLKEEEEGAQQEKLISLFKSKTLLKRTAIFFYMWFIVGLGYYGLSFNVKNLSGNLYLNHMISASVDLLGPFSVMASKWTGRKVMTVSHLFLGGAALMTSAMVSAFLIDMENLPIDVDALNIGVFVVGKYGISVVFSFAYFWCTEVYPTTVRSSLAGISSMFARVGSILSPILVDLYKFVDTPLKLGFGPLIFSLTMIIGGFLTLLLPETANTTVPETIAEANAFHPGKSNKRSYSFSMDGKLNDAFKSETKL